MRLTVEYGLLPLPKADEEQGFTANFYVPSPIETNRHVFFNVTSFVGWINAGGHLNHDATSKFGLLFRF